MKSPRSWSPASSSSVVPPQLTYGTGTVLRGSLLAIVATVLVSWDAVLFILAARLGASHRAAIFWKLLAAGIVNGIEAVFEHFDNSNEIRQFFALKNWLWFILTIGFTNAAVCTAISFSFLLTYTANGLLGYACNIIWGAFMGAIYLGDKLDIRIFVWSVIIFSGIAVMAWDTATQGDSQKIVGDCCGLGAGFLFAIFLTENRRAEQLGISIPIGLVLCISLLLTAFATFIVDFIIRPSVPGIGNISQTPFAAAFVAACDGLLMGIVSPLFGAAVESIPAARVSLIALCEIPIATVLVYIFYHQKQNSLGLIGDAIVLFGLLGNATSEVFISLQYPIQEDSATKTHSVPSLSKDTHHNLHKLSYLRNSSASLHAQSSSCGDFRSSTGSLAISDLINAKAPLLPPLLSSRSASSVVDSDDDQAMGLDVDAVSP